MSRVGFFLFFLAVIGVVACESEADKSVGQTKATQTTGQKTIASVGMVVFRQNCVICHGADGRLGLNGAKDLTLSERPLEERVQLITHGKNLMAPFQSILSPEEIAAVAAYTLTLKK